MCQTVNKQETAIMRNITVKNISNIFLTKLIFLIVVKTYNVSFTFLTIFKCTTQ